MELSADVKEAVSMSKRKLARRRRRRRALGLPPRNMQDSRPEQPDVS